MCMNLRSSFLNLGLFLIALFLPLFIRHWNELYEMLPRLGMQLQTTIMTTLEQCHTGGAMLWSLIKHIGSSWTHVIFEGRRNQMNVNQCIVMPWIKNLATLINTTFMHPLVTTLMVAPLLVRIFDCLTIPTRYIIQVTKHRVIVRLITNPIFFRMNLVKHHILYTKNIDLFYFPVTIRCSDRYLAMILVPKNMLKFITIGQMCKRLFMPTQPKFHIDGLLAGEFPEC